MIKGCLARDYDLDASIAAFIAEAKALKWGQPCGFNDPVGNFKDALVKAKRAEVNAVPKADLVAVTMEIVQFREDLARLRGKAEASTEKASLGRPPNSDDLALMFHIKQENPNAGKKACRDLFHETLRKLKDPCSKRTMWRRSQAAWGFVEK
jgi:hypothetical protein